MISTSSLPDKTVKRLLKVIIRTVHLVGIAGVFGGAMIGSVESTYLFLAIASGVLLTLMDACSGLIWFVQLRGISLYLKLLLLHIYSSTSIPCLITVIVISGFMSHAPTWIRYFSLPHWKVVHSKGDLLG